jgi:hypothetical protein
MQADLSIFNVLDECVLGPRGNQPQTGVKAELTRHYPKLIETYHVVHDDLAPYISARQSQFRRDA